MDPKQILRLLLELANRLRDTEITTALEDMALRTAIDNIKPGASNRILAKMLCTEFPWLGDLQILPPQPDEVVEQLGRFYAVLTEEE